MVIGYGLRLGIGVLGGVLGGGLDPNPVFLARNSLFKYSPILFQLRFN